MMSQHGRLAFVMLCYVKVTLQTQESDLAAAKQLCPAP
jgi:hypothetical protein